MDAPPPVPLVTSAAFAPAFGLCSASLQATLASKRPAKRAWRRAGIDLDAISIAHVLDCGDGVRLTGRFAPASGSSVSRGLVVLIHGWEGHHDSRDDSVIPVRDFEGLAARGSVLAYDLTDRGGHCGVVENWRFDSWAERRVVELLARV